MSQKLTIIFDLDGTLVETAPDLIRAHNHVMAKYGFKSKKSITIFILMYIGYDIFPISRDYKLYKKLILCYQSHFIQENITGKLDTVTFNKIIDHFLTA